MAKDKSLRRFLAPDAAHAGQVVTLGPEPSRHLTTVLRIGVGDRVRLFDGRGAEFIGCVEAGDAAAAQVRIEEACQMTATPSIHLTVAFAPPPGQRADALIEKACELGADRLVPLVCERLQDFQAAAAGKRRARWDRKAADAARQSGRTKVPMVAPPAAFDEFVRADSADLRLIGSTGEAQSLWRVLSDTSGPVCSVTMVTGPAGGFTRREMELAHEAGFAAVSLGPEVLRVETAALAMLAVLTAWRASPIMPGR